MRTHKNKKGVSATVIVIMLAVFFGAIIYYATMKSEQKEYAAGSWSYFEIKELGVKFKVPAQIKDLSYSLTPDKKTAFIGTASLEKADQDAKGTYCSIKDGPLGYISNVEKYFTNRGVTPTESDSVHQIGSTWVYYVHPQATCSGVAEVESLQTSQLNALQAAFKTTEKI